MTATIRTPKGTATLDIPAGTKTGGVDVSALKFALETHALLSVDPRPLVIEPTRCRKCPPGTYTIRRGMRALGTLTLHAGASA